MDRGVAAYHEAGHAVAIWKLLNRAPRETTIAPRQEIAGYVLHANPLRGLRLETDDSSRAETEIHQGIMICLAGAVAQRRFAPRSIRGWHPRNDYQRAADLATRVCGSDIEVNAMLRWLQIRTENLIETGWREVEAVANALLERDTLSSEEIVAAIREI